MITMIGIHILRFIPNVQLKDVKYVIIIIGGKGHEFF